MMIFMLRIPNHIAIIPDGNRRLAKRLLNKPWKGHEWGVGKVKDIIEWCKELGTKVVTIYLLSLENLDKRPKRELNFLFGLARKEISEILSDKKHIVHRNKVRVTFFGRLDLLPGDLQRDIKEVTEKTRKYSDYYLNLAIAYGGRQEIVGAAVRMANDAAIGKLVPSKIDESVMRSYFLTSEFEDPDLIIRTGGERRLSNFLPFQSTYSELVFLDKFWPELGKKDFFDAVKEFGERDRRFGK
jgi:tritrans,polycis-undecaprenyl-diphosphate synthase [geranylgeranyl-diphosphate specific]